jgi:hypothetical protein
MVVMDYPKCVFDMRNSVYMSYTLGRLPKKKTRSYEPYRHLRSLATGGNGLFALRTSIVSSLYIKA